MAGLKEVSRNAGVKASDAKSLFAAVITLLGNGEKSVKIPGFGSFQLKPIPGRVVESPVIQNGEPIVIDPQWGIKFTLAPASKRRVNGLVAKKIRFEEEAKKLAVNPNPPKKAMRSAKKASK